MDNDRFDIVLYGASGFTGAHVLKLLLLTKTSGVRFAVAGRSESRIQGVLKKLAHELDLDSLNIDILIANIFDDESLAAMAKQAKVIINVVGPFRLYGEAVVKAAVENGASYVDISGEPAFLEKMQMKYADLARQNNVHVVGSCGWDSIPCDLGVHLLKKKFDGQLNHVETFVKLNSGPAGYSINAGTYRSLILGLANAQTDGLGNIRKHIMPERMPKSAVRPEKRGTLWENEAIESWCLPFYGSDKSVVTRSQYFEYTQNKALPAHVETYLCIKSYLWALLLALWLMAFSTLVKWRPIRNFLMDHPNLCTFGMFTKEGPTKRQIEQASFSYWFFGSGWNEKHSSFSEFTTKPNKKMTILCTGPDAGYEATSGCVLAAALSLLQDKDKLPPGGVYTPAAALKNTGVYERLKQFKINFEVVSDA